MSQSLREEVKAGAEEQLDAVQPPYLCIHDILITRLSELTWLQPRRPGQCDESR